MSSYSGVGCVGLVVWFRSDDDSFWYINLFPGLLQTSYQLFSFNVRSSEWIKITKSCEATQSCVISGNIIEVIHAAIQIVLSVSMTSCLLLTCRVVMMRVEMISNTCPCILWHSLDPQCMHIAHAVTVLGDLYTARSKMLKWGCSIW